MSRTWWSIRVELVSGRGSVLDPAPGRILAATRGHSFAQLALAINVGLGRWDLAPAHVFTLADGTLVSDRWKGELDSYRTTLSRLHLGAEFSYVFNPDDPWSHRCSVGPEKMDPEDEFGIVPSDPRPYFGWGSLPDQYAT